MSARTHSATLRVSDLQAAASFYPGALGMAARSPIPETRTLDYAGYVTDPGGHLGEIMSNQKRNG